MIRLRSVKTVLYRLRNDSNIFFLLILFSFAAFFFFWKLGRNHLIEYDEAIYALVAKNIVKTSDPLNLTVNGVTPWLDKPPLYFWLSALSMKFFGFTSLAPRLPSAFLGLATVLATYFLGRELFNARVGFLAALILASTVGFLYYARLAMLDVSLTFFLAMSLLFFVRGRRRPKEFLLMGLFLGLALLTKNFISLLLLPIIIIFTLYEFQTHQVRPRIKFLLLGFLIGLLVALPWHLYMILKHGLSFVDTYLTYHTLWRISRVLEGEGAPPLWYLKVIQTQFRIWFLFLWPALIWSLARIIKKETAVFFVGLATAVIFFGFSLAKSKLIWFILPIYPFLAILVAGFLEWFRESLFGEKFKIVFLVAVFLLALGYNFKKMGRIIPVDFAAGLTAAIAAAEKSDPERPLVVSPGEYYTASYYNTVGLVQTRSPEAIRQLVRDKIRVFLIFPADYFPENFDFSSYASYYHRYGSYYLVDKTGN